MWLQLPSGGYNSAGEKVEVGMNQAAEPDRVYIEFKNGEEKMGFTVRRAELLGNLGLLKTLAGE